ncbi:MAG: hypothetical protein ACLUUO_15940 [Sellimonas intestinalis]
MSELLHDYQICNIPSYWSCGTGKCWEDRWFYRGRSASERGCTISPAGGLDELDEEIWHLPGSMKSSGSHTPPA